MRAPPEHGRSSATDEASPAKSGDGGRAPATVPRSGPRARVVCVGQRLVSTDAFGLVVHDKLADAGLPDDVELVDGGVGGLRLLSFMEGCEHVVFVDTVQGFGAPGELVVLSAEEVTAYADARWGHDAGLPYLLSVAPKVCDHPPNRTTVVGIERGATRADIDRVVEVICAMVVPRHETPSAQTTTNAAPREP